MKKKRVGKVVSARMQKTVVVEVERTFRHPLYQKIRRRSKKYKAHDEKAICKVGDLVEILETRPLSKDKRWRVVKVIHSGEAK